MPKKKQIKRDEIVSDAGLVLDAEQAATVRKQMYDESYSLDAPDIRVTDDDIFVSVGATVYTVYGDSSLHTTTVLRRSETTYTPAAIRLQVDVESTVRDAIERARDAAEAAIKAINEEWEANVGEPDDIGGDDEDEGLREGPVVGSGPYPGFTSRSDAEASDTSPKGLARRIAYADDLVWRLDAAEAERDLITLPNAEYADLVAAARRDAAFREAFTGVLATDDSEVDLEALNAAFAGIPAGPYDVIEHSAGWEVRQLDADPTNAHHWPVRLCQGISGQKAGFDDAAANFIAGVLNAWPLIAARLAATESVVASDVSGAVLDDGGPVEPELDIDALVAGAASVFEDLPEFTEGLCGDGAAILKDGAPMRITEILTDLAQGAAARRLAEVASGRATPTTVDFHVGGRVMAFAAERGAVEDLRKALSDVQRSGGLL